MDGPASSAPAGAIAGHKLLLVGIPIAVTVLAWWLGMRAFPPRKGREWGDMLDRLLACAASSFAVGLPIMLGLHRHAGWIFGSASELAVMAGLPPMAGFFALVSCVGLLSSLPGPWIVVAYLRWFHRRRRKDIGELARDARREILPGTDE